MTLFSRKSKSKSKAKAYLALDIGSELVKSVIFTIEQEKINVLGYGKHQQGKHALPEGIVKDLSQIIENAELAIAQASLQAGIRPAEAVMGISGEQVKGFSTIVQFERTKPDVKISEKEMNNIIEKVQETAYESSLEKFKKEIGNKDLELKLVNAALTHIMIDGERIDNPIGFRGKQMQVGIFNAYAPLVQLSNLQKIAEQLEIELLAVAAEPYTLAEAIIPDDDLNFEAIIIDIGGSTTDVIVVQHQDVIGAKMFGLGGSAVTQELSEIFAIPQEEARELKEKYVSKELSDEEQIEKIEGAIEQSLEYWRAGLEVALSEFKELEYLPHTILLTGGGSLLPQIKEVITKIGKEKGFPFAKELAVQVMTPQHFTYISDQTAKLESPEEIVPLSLTMMVLDLFEEQESFDIAVKKSIKLFEK